MSWGGHLGGMSRGWVSRGGYVQGVGIQGVGISKEGGYPGRMRYIGGGYSWDLRDYGYS